MVPFEFYVPHHLDEALELLDPEDGGVRPVGGGTAVMLMLKAGILHPTRLISLQSIERCHSEIAVTAEGALHIGGLATLASLENDPRVSAGWPVLTRALRTLANVRVRSVATIGGGLAHADPHMDMPPVLSSLGATATLISARGKRTIPVAELSTGYYETVLGRDELVLSVTVPPQPKMAAYLKVTTRAAHDWPALGLAAAFELRDGRIESPRIVVGAATDCPTVLVEAQKVLAGSELNAQALTRAGEAAAAEIEVVGDPHGSASYKRHLLGVMLGRTVRVAIEASAK